MFIFLAWRYYECFAIIIVAEVFIERSMAAERRDICQITNYISLLLLLVVTRHTHKASYIFLSIFRYTGAVVCHVSIRGVLSANLEAGKKTW